MFCANCGTPLEDADNFCGACGQRVLRTPTAGAPAGPATAPGTPPAADWPAPPVQAQAPATAQPAAGAPPERMSVPLFVLLAIVTLGFYSAFWYRRQYAAFNGLASPQRLDASGFPALLTLAVINLALVFTGLTAETMGRAEVALVINVFGNLVSIAYWVVLLVLAFRMRRMLMDHAQANGQPVHLSGVWTFLFGFYYVQYRVNRMFHEPTPGYAPPA